MIGRLTKDEAEVVLNNNVFGHIGCNDGFNTYVFPVNYYFDGKYIHCHSKPGAKVEVMRLNKRVCLQVEEVNDFVHWKSIMILGEFQELLDTRERYAAIKGFVDHMLHLKPESNEMVYAKKYLVSPNFNDGRNYIIYRIVIDEITGRYEEA